MCYDNVNSQASKILLAVDLGNFENNNKSNESVSFSSHNPLSLSLFSRYISPCSFSSTVPIKNIEEIAFFALKAQLDEPAPAPAWLRGTHSFRNCCVLS